MIILDWWEDCISDDCVYYYFNLGSHTPKLRGCIEQWLSDNYGYEDSGTPEPGGSYTRVLISMHSAHHFTICVKRGLDV